MDTVRMELTPEEQAVLDGSEGEVMAKALTSIVRYGEIFGAARLRELDGPIHVVTSMGMTGLAAPLDMQDVLIDAGLWTKEPFTCSLKRIANGTEQGRMRHLSMSAARAPSV